MQPKQNISTLLAGLLILLIGVCPGIIWAEYPNKVVQMTVGFKAGSITDLFGRLVAKGLEDELKVPVAVINRGGAGGALAYDQVHRANPDGYTIGWVTGSLFTTTNIGNLDWGYDGLEPVARIAQWPLAIGVREDSPWESWQEFLTDAWKNPGKYKFGNAGTGSIGHLMNVAVSSGVNLIHVPIGADRRFPALLGGQIDLLSAPAADFLSFSTAGQVRALVAGSEERVVFLPETPTARELGINFEINLMYGVFVPPGTPEEPKERLRTALRKVTASYEPLRKFAETKGMSLGYLDGPALATWLNKQNSSIAGVMKEMRLYKSPSGEK